MKIPNFFQQWRMRAANLLPTMQFPSIRDSKNAVWDGFTLEDRFWFMGIQEVHFTIGRRTTKTFVVETTPDKRKRFVSELEQLFFLKAENEEAIQRILDNAKPKKPRYFSKETLDEIKTRWDALLDTRGMLSGPVGAKLFC